MGLIWTPLTLILRNPFRISYGTSDTRQVFWIRLTGDSCGDDSQHDSGWGEAAIPPYYGVQTNSMTDFWETLARSGRAFPDDPDQVENWVGLQGPAPARCAVEMALYDRIARQRGQTLYALLGLPKPQPLATCFTLGIDTPQHMARMAQQAGSLPILKIKLGVGGDEVRLAAIREARPDARLWVDGNAGWTFDQAAAELPMLEKFEIEMLEQPLPKEQIERMGELQRQTRIPIVADESLQTMDHLERLAAAGVKAVNLKLQKLGGLSPGVRVARRARELGLHVLLGCMIESSLGTTAMAHLMALADWIDLDAPMLISNDPFDGLHYAQNGLVSLPERIGIGVIRKG